MKRGTGNEWLPDTGSCLRPPRPESRLTRVGAAALAEAIELYRDGFLAGLAVKKTGPV